MVFGLAAFFLLPRSVSDARFLTEGEKKYVEHQLREDGIISKDSADDDFRWKDVVQTYTRPSVVLLLLAVFFNGTTETGLA